MRRVRTDIRKIVDDAKAAGRPISSTLIWGLLPYDVSWKSMGSTLAVMVNRGHLVTVEVAPGVFGDYRSLSYEPGPTPVVEVNTGRDYITGMLGNMQHKRLVEARAASRKWLKAA